MRRGLMGWDPQELPKSALESRLARLQAAMARENLDAMVFYTNLVRPSAVCWLTGFTPYWIESLLLVRRDGAPVLATALSKRVSEWIKSTSWLEEIINTPKPGTAIGERLKSGACRRVGVLELDALPAGSYDDLIGTAPGAELIDASRLFAGCRHIIDPTERQLIERADAITRAALDQVGVAQAQNAQIDAGVLMGLVEKHARLAAAEESYMAAAPDLDADRRLIRVSGAVPLAGRFAVRASVAYKGSWVRRTRTFVRDAKGAQIAARADAWLTAFASKVAADVPLPEQLAASLKSLPGAELRNWMAESSIGSYPLEVVASSRQRGTDAPARGSFAVLSIELVIDGAPWLGAMPAFVGA
jgi:hypothetical protein